MKFTLTFFVSIILILEISSAYSADTARINNDVPHVVTPAIQVPEFSWDGFYLGVQNGINFGKNAEIGDTKFSVKAKADKLISNSFFAGYNINLGNSLVFGVENDFNFAKAEAEAKYFSKDVSENYNKYYKSDRNIRDESIDILVKKFTNTEEYKNKLSIYLKYAAETDKDMELKSTATVLKVTKDATVSFEQKWSGATRVRLGFAVDRFMPYLAGGIAYTSFNGTSVSNDTATVARNSKTDTIQHKTILHFLQNYITLSKQHLLNHLKIAKSCLVLPLVLVLTLR